MTASKHGERTVVQIFVDPMCPFAWLTSRWLVEVERLGRIELTIRVMSLSILNEGRHDVSDFYQDLVDRAWAPARIAIAIERDHGHGALRAWYDDLGRRIHVGHEPVDDELISETLAAVGLPATLLTATLLAEGRAGAAADPHARSDDIDVRLRASHRCAVESVGHDVGTPVVHIVGDDRTIAFFGPVVNPAPVGADAVQLFDGIVLVAGTSGFFELKRTRTGPLVLA